MVKKKAWNISIIWIAAPKMSDFYHKPGLINEYIRFMILTMNRDRPYLFIIQSIGNACAFSSYPTHQKVRLVFHLWKVADPPVPMATVIVGCWVIHPATTTVVAIGQAATASMPPHTQRGFRPGKLNASFSRGPPRIGPFQKPLGGLPSSNILNTLSSIDSVWKRNLSSFCS